MNDLEMIREFHRLQDDLQRYMPGTWPVLRDHLHVDGDVVYYRPDGDYYAFMVKKRWSMLKRHAKEFGFEVVWEND